VSVPVSWPRLERFASGGLRAAEAQEIESHVASCAACRACLDELRADVVALPPLPAIVPASPLRFARWLFAGGGLALAAAAILILVVMRGSSAGEPGARVAVKGAGEVVLSLVRERDGAIAYDPSTFRAGDRIKVRVTCAPGPSIWADVIVYQRGESAFPLAPARVPCGNDTVVPGAFRIDGSAPARVCVELSAGPAPMRGGANDLACVSLAPE
jgi:hypothetical protein